MCDTMSLDRIWINVIMTMLRLTPRRPDVATLACVAANGGMGSPGDNASLTASYSVVSGLASACL
jgi:hypothetical protein